MSATYPHAQDADGCAADEAPRVPHAAAEQVGPAELGEHGGENVAEGDDPLWRGRGNQVERGGEYNDIEHCCV